MEEKELTDQDSTQENPHPVAPTCRRAGEARRYFFDFLVIVAGIAVTFMVSGWIGNSRDRKELRRHLESVRIELEENLGFLEDMSAYYKTSYNLSLYLSERRPAQHNRDSVYSVSLYNDHWSVIHYNPAFVYASSAYETLKTSGMMNMIKDQSFSMALIKCYKLLEEVKLEADSYMQRKNDALFAAILENKVLFESDMDILDPSLETYFYFLAAPFAILSVEDCLRQIASTLPLF